MTGTGAAPAVETAPLVANYRSYFGGWGVEGRVDGPVRTFRSGVANAMLNALTESSVSVEEALPIARERLRGVPWLWDVTPDALPGTAAALEALGGRQVGSMPVMAVDAGGLRLPTAPPADVHVVDVVEDVPGWTAAWMPAMGVEPDARDRLLRLHRDRVAVTDRLVQLGVVADGAFRATAELHLTGTVGGVYLVATEEAYRGRGFASALVVAAARRALAEGATVLTLQSSPAGESVYRRVGFETVARIDRYVLPD